ncbi:MAG TPA: dTDP-4-dehydrorhamnose 3,5-epimerase [Sphingomonadaceae bacterium]|nr:dTDP-4-dehydrorhamnose 3,5-epimerase [Sphingomonadaceae bacterium]
MPVLLLTVRRFEDNRGWFSESYHQAKWANAGIDETFIQDNHSLSRPVGTIRGLHFQAPPHAQAKLIRCIRGAIWDVAVDIRHGSPTYGQWQAAELSAENGHQLYIPAGFAHGFVTLQPDSEVAYKASALYAPENEGGLRWDDPALGINWPLPSSGAIVSDKDAVLPRLADLESPFAYEGGPLEPLVARSPA